MEECAAREMTLPLFSFRRCARVSYRAGKRSTCDGRKCGEAKGERKQEVRVAFPSGSLYRYFITQVLFFIPSSIPQLTVVVWSLDL